MYEFGADTIIKWPGWDPHEQDARLDGPFAVGGTGWSKPRGGPANTWTITEVDDQHAWASECALPGGKLTGRSTFTVTGPLTPLFRWHFARRIRRDWFATWAALEIEADRRVAA